MPLISLLFDLCYKRFAGAIALEIGWGGISKMEELTGMSHSTIGKGIDEQAKEFINHEYPVISVDAKKKENVGNFKNPGQNWTKKGLTIAARLDENEYLKGIKFSNEDIAKLHMEPHDLHPKWNYNIFPNCD